MSSVICVASRGKPPPTRRIGNYHIALEQYAGDVLDLNRDNALLYAFKVGLLAFDATRLCAADVDFPVDVLLYSRGSFEIVEQRYQRDDLRAISEWWQERMRQSVHDLPSEWIEAAFPSCVSR